MRGKWLAIINVAILIIAILVLGGMLWNFSSEDAVVNSEECVDVNAAPSFSYDSCYDAYSKTIFLEIKRGKDDYKINFLKVSFFDFDSQFYKLTDVPVMGGSQAYKISAERNPQNLDVVFDVVKNFSVPICNNTKKVFVSYCPARVNENGFNVSISPLDGVGADDYVEVVKDVFSNSDIFNLNLVDREMVWESKCKSDWKCGEWESCVDGVQRRGCKDVNKCFVSTNVPLAVRYCNGTCVEDWKCEWSGCSGGYTVPACRDLNDCGTSYDVPQKLECNFLGECVPDIECGEWTSCEVNYNFMNLIEEKVSSLEGIKSRICRDKNFCVDSEEEIRSCSVGVDIYVKKFIRCGAEFIGVYNKLNDNLIARVKEGTGENLYMDIYFDDRENSSYCDYCYDNVLDGDETGIDCGGDCMSCDDKYKVVVSEAGSWFDNFVNWLNELF